MGIPMNTTHDSPPGIEYRLISTKKVERWCANPRAYGHLSSESWGAIRGVGRLVLGWVSVLTATLLPLSPIIAPRQPLPVQALLHLRPHTSLPDNLRLLQGLLPAA